MKLIKIGTWSWGIITALLAIIFLGIVIAAGFYILPDGDHYSLKKDAPILLFGIFYALKDNGSLVAGILGFSGLAWSHFFKLNNSIK